MVSNFRLTRPSFMHEIASLPGSDGTLSCSQILLNVHAECFVPASKNSNELVSPVLYKPNEIEIISDFYVSDDSLLSECSFLNDISTPDISGFLDSNLILSSQEYTMSDARYVYFVITVLVLSAFIIWEIVSDPNTDPRGDDPISILRSLKEKNSDRPILAHLNINFLAPKCFEFIN